MKTRPAADGSPPADPAGGQSRRVAVRRAHGKAANGHTGEMRRQRHDALAAPNLPLADPGAMFGRQTEVARLRALWSDAVAGSSGLVLIAGEPGVGKTRLVAELARTAEVEGGTVLVGRCEHHRLAPYGPFVDALGPALAGASDTWLAGHVERYGPGLLRLFPELGRRLPSARDQHAGSRSQLLGAVAGVLTDAEGAHPLLLVLEDLHWATRSTVLMLEHLIQNVIPAPVLVVGTYRDDAISPGHPLADLLTKVASDGRTERMTLGTLASPAVTTLLADRAELVGRTATAVAVELWRATEGNPLVVTEAIRELLAGGSLADVVVSADEVADSGIPRDVAALVARRMGRCRSTTRGLVEAASVLGVSFSLDEVVTLTELKDDAVKEALDKAVEAALLVALEDGRQPPRYRFIHELVQDAVYRSLPANRRVRLHHQMADVLEAGGDTTVLVHHLSAASPVGRSPDAVLHARRAAEAAMDVLAFEEAAGFYGQALAFLGPEGDSTLRTDLLMDLGRANHRAEESARARQSYLQAAALARASQDGPRLGRAVLGLGDVLGTWGTDGLLIGLLEHALDVAGDEPGLEAALTARLAQAKGASTSPDERKAQSDHAWELAWDSPDSETMSRVLRARHEALSAPDDLADRLEADGELVAMSIAAGDDQLTLQAYAWRSVDLLEDGQLTEADRDRETHAKLARKLGDAKHRAEAARWTAMRALLEGRPRRITTQIEKAFTLGNEAHDAEASPVYWMQQHALVLDWGDREELERLLEAWQNPARGDDGNPVWRSSLALLLARAGRLEEAADELDYLFDHDCADLPLDRMWLPTVGALGETAGVLGDARSALLAKLLAPYAERLLVVGPGAVCRGSVSRVVGLLWATAGRWTEAERQFQAAFAAHERLDSRPLLVRTRVDFGLAMAQQPGGPPHLGRCRTLLGQGAEEAEAAGMTRLALEARATIASLPAL